MSLKTLVSTFCALLVVWSVSSASAQDFVTPEPAQLRLYEEGAAAFRAKDYEKSVELFQASLHLGKLNVTYLNMGRALFKLQRCPEALQAYKSAMTAPQVSAPTPEQVKNKMEQYRADLSKSCPGFLILECRVEDVKDLKITIDKKQKVTCTADPIALAPGVHYILGEIKGMEPSNMEVEITSMEEKRLKIQMAKPEIRRPTKKPAGLESRGWIVGARLGRTLGGTGGLSFNVETSNDTSTSNFTEDPGYAFHFYGDYELFKGIGLGASLGFYPGLSLGNGRNNSNLGSSSFSEGDLNLYAIWRFPGVLRWSIQGGGGLTSISPEDPAEGTEESFVGFNIQAGVGGFYDLGGWLLNYDLIFEQYQGTRETTGPDYTLDETLKGNRFMLSIGVGWEI